MIYVLSGGAVGATLIVSCPSNVTVTVSKGNKTYTKNSGDLGSATFKGLDTGTWTVKIQSSSQTATKNITITTDYEITMAFFAAYINITYPANSTCTVKTSGGVTVASNSNTGTSTKTWKATVGATGTYTITATSTSDSSKTKSTTVSITADGQSKSVTLKYETYYYNRGDKCTAVTGGWSKTGTGGSLTFGSASMTLVANSFQNPTDASTTNKVSLANIKTLYFSVKSATTYGTAGSPRVGVATTNNPKSNDASQWSASKTLSASSAFTTVSIDVSGLTGSYYIVAGGFNGDSGTATIEIQAIWGTD